MIYENTDLSALDALERARTGSYGEDGYDEPRRTLVGICECRGCSNEIYSGDVYYEVEVVGGKDDGEVKLVCERCMDM